MSSWQSSPERHDCSMKTILIFDLADVLIEGFDSFVKALSKQLSLPAPDVVRGVGGNP
jgi:hypothetical protein